MAGGQVVLSKRLRSLADMVSHGKSVVDVGCDHGFVSIYLVQHGISSRVLAMDVRQGPLSRAQEHIAEYELEDYIETRLSDGLSEFREGEAQALVCAGMGGKLMMKILTEGEKKAKALDELILQPQSELPLFRRFLKESGYRILDENILLEDGKFYFLFKVRFEKGVVQDENSKAEPNAILYEKYGELLLQRRHPVLRQYLEFMLETAAQIEENLGSGQGERAAGRILEIRQEIKDLQAAIAMYEE